MNIVEISPTSIFAFATTILLMAITPGPAVMQVVGHSISNGWRASQASILGVLAGNALYCALSVLGLGTLILAAPWLFETIKWVGVIYLAWLGLKALASMFKEREALEAPALKAGPATLFRQSFILQGANPKSVLFFCTLLPVFAGEAEGAPIRIAQLGAIAIVMEYPILLGYSLLGAKTGKLFSGNLGRRLLDGISGSALIAAAGTVASTSIRAK